MKPSKNFKGYIATFLFLLLLSKVGAIHLTKEHNLTAMGMKENPKQWKFRTVKVPVS